MSQTLSRSRRSSGRGSTDNKPSFSGKVDDLQDILTGIPDRPSKRLMTFDELQQSIGSKPKKDRFFGAKKMSTRYKAIGARLAELQQKLGEATVGDLEKEGGRKAFEQDLLDQLDEVDAAAKRYQKKHKGKKGNAVQGLVDDIDRFRKEVKPTLDSLTTGASKGLPDELPVDQAMAAGRSGIKPGQLKGVSPKHCNFALLNDDNMTAPPKFLGKGAVNSVQIITHGGVERVFKKEQQVDKSGAWAPNMMGIDTQNDPRYGNRNVAGSMVGKLLGTKVMPEATFGISGGEVGLVMEKAPGMSARELFSDDGPGIPNLSPKAMGSLQNQMADLEVCDILTGQTDRHPGNYMIDIKGEEVTVTGIDNDFAFPDATKAMGEKGRVPLKFMSMNSIPNLPRLIGKDTADRVKKIDFDRDMAPSFAGLLNDAELNSTKDRLEKLQQHIRALEQSGCIVADWVKWRSKDGQTATEYLSDDDEAQSLFGRDAY